MAWPDKALQFGLVVGEQVLAKVARAGILQEHLGQSFSLGS